MSKGVRAYMAFLMGRSVVWTGSGWVDRQPYVGLSAIRIPLLEDSVSLPLSQSSWSSQLMAADLSRLEFGLVFNRTSRSVGNGGSA